MDATFVNNHREKALNAFRRAIQMAENSLDLANSSNDIEKAKGFVELAELHMLSFDIMKAEHEFTVALNLFYKLKEDVEGVRVDYVIYILKALAGIHECLGRRKEAKDEMRKAMILDMRTKTIGRPFAFHSP